MNYFGKPVNFEDMICFYGKEFKNKDINYLRGYLTAVNKGPIMKAFNALFMRDNGARYAAAHKALEELIQTREA